ncbi:MAG: helicase-related protein, partial [Deltaproteobacteria bacterium]
MPLPPIISRSSRTQRARSWTRISGTIVAEALVTVAEPLVTVLRPGPPAAPARVAAALARSLAPEEAPDPAPAWLWPEQRMSFRRAVAAVRRYGGALLADPVGTGKTYVALAVAAALNRRPTACLVPAALAEQWRAVAARLRVPTVVWSHERLSRGALPGECGRLVLVDESHHFRNPAARRYRHVAPWLVGRRALLVSASPVHNGLADLGHQLALTLRDDALRRHGLPSLAAGLATGRGHHALSHVIIVGPAAAARRPGAREQLVRLEDSTLAPLAPALALVERLRLSSRAPIAALVRWALWCAAASSPAALAASVDRYRRLLLHARDAAASGRAPDRRTLRNLTCGLDDQLLFWELLDPKDGTPDLAPDDLPLLEELGALASAAARAPDPKVERLRDLLADGRPTLVFAIARETVRHLRDRLPGPLAWCTGERAGIGRQAAPRQAVLDWFRPASGDAGSSPSLVPRHLIATDVAAEGLDLHRAERVVHYDLPWTQARLDQREGRARRAGAAHVEVEVVRLDPPPMVDERLRQLACLARKRRLLSAAGLDEPGRALWRWRADLAERFRERAAAEGVALLPAGPPGILAGFELHAWPAADTAVASHVLWWDKGSGWTEDPDVVSARLETAAAPRLDARQPPPSDAVRAALALLAAPIRQRMAELRRSRWLGAHATPAVHRL